MGYSNRLSNTVELALSVSGLISISPLTLMRGSFHWYSGHCFLQPPNESQTLERLHLVRPHLQVITDLGVARGRTALQ